MATSTMDNASAHLAIALQLNDLDELEASGIVDKAVIALQREQLKIDSGFDAVTFEASRRLALSIAKAVEDDSTVIARSTRLPQIDDATFDHLARLNHPAPTALKSVEPSPQPKGTDPALPSMTKAQKRARSPTPDEEPSAPSIYPKEAGLPCSSHAALDHAAHSRRRIRGEQTANVQSPNEVENSVMPTVQDPQEPPSRRLQSLQNAQAAVTPSSSTSS